MSETQAVLKETAHSTTVVAPKPQEAKKAKPAIKSAPKPKESMKPNPKSEEAEAKKAKPAPKSQAAKKVAGSNSADNKNKKQPPASSAKYSKKSTGAKKKEAPRTDKNGILVDYIVQAMPKDRKIEYKKEAYGAILNKLIEENPDSTPVIINGDKASTIDFAHLLIDISTLFNKVEAGFQREKERGNYANSDLYYQTQKDMHAQLMNSVKELEEILNIVIVQRGISLSSRESQYKKTNSLSLKFIQRMLKQKNEMKAARKETGVKEKQNLDGTTTEAPKETTVKATEAATEK